MGMDLSVLFREQRHHLEDFWGRRKNAPVEERPFRIFGRPFKVTSNEPGLLIAVDLCLPLYSTAPESELSPFRLHLVVQPGPEDPGPVPEDLVDRAQYAAHGGWLIIRLGRWGDCFVDLASGCGYGLLSPRLAARPEVVSRCLLNTVFTNHIIGSGFGLLHASCLVRDGRALLLMAPHNSGKSTTALRLVLASYQPQADSRYRLSTDSGYRLLTDSMVFLSPAGEPLRLFGFPVGQVKLREDVLPHFGELAPHLEPEPVRGEVKYRIDLRSLDPDLVHPQALAPPAVFLCLLTQGSRTRLGPADQEQVLAAIVRNSLFYDTDAVWERNLASIQTLLERATLWTLDIGADQARIVETVNRLWEMA
jgi:hypothetical protein